MVYPVIRVSMWFDFLVNTETTRWNNVWLFLVKILLRLQTSDKQQHSTSIPVSVMAATVNAKYTYCTCRWWPYLFKPTRALPSKHDLLRCRLLEEKKKVTTKKPSQKIPQNSEFPRASRFQHAKGLKAFSLHFFLFYETCCKMNCTPATQFTSLAEFWEAFLTKLKGH